MAVQWINNREVKYQEKNEKYRNVLEQVEFEYPNYEVNHLTSMYSEDIPNTCVKTSAKLSKIKLGLSLLFIIRKNKFCHQLHT